MKDCVPLENPFLLSSRLEAGVMTSPPPSSDFFPAGPVVAFLGGVTTSLSLAGGALTAGDLNAGERAVADAAFETFKDPVAALRPAAELEVPFSSWVCRERLLGGANSLIRVWKSFSRLLNLSLTTRDL